MKLIEGPCEASRGIDTTGPSPVIIKCHAPGIERPDVRPRALVAPIMCDECYEAERARSL